MLKRIFLGALCGAAFLTLTPAQAGILLVNGTGSTVYGATAYVCCDAGGPTYIFNNTTLLTDILSSPGNGYQIANPVVANNVAQSGIVGAPYFFGWTGGVSPDGVFGSGLTADSGPAVGFALSDTTAGCCAASYMVTSIFDNFVVDGGGFAGNLGAYLAIGGTNFNGNDASVAAAIVNYNINNTGWFTLPQLVLAASGNCLTSVALGGSGAALQNAACGNGGNGGAFQGLAIDNFLAALNPGDTISVKATITAYADPSTIDSIVPDISLINLTGTTLPDFALADTGATAPSPEPGTYLLFGCGITALALVRRRKNS